MCFYYDDNYPAVYQETKPTARKDHRCSECGEAIRPGTTYDRIFGVWEGDAVTFKICPACYALREQVADIERSRGCAEDESYPPLGMLHESISDQGYTEEDFAAVGAAADPPEDTRTGNLPFPED